MQAAPAQAPIQTFQTHATQGYV